MTKRTMKERIGQRALGAGLGALLGVLLGGGTGIVGHGGGIAGVGLFTAIGAIIGFLLVPEVRRIGSKMKRKD